MEKCVTAFVGASNADIDGAIRNLSQLGNFVDPIVTLFTRSIDAFRSTPKRPNPVLENCLPSGENIPLDIDNTVGKRFWPEVCKPEGLIVAKYFTM